MYHKGIPFAEHNFSPFQDIFFVIVLFESQSKTLFRVLFSSLYLQICIFYFGISKYLNFTRELRRRFDRKYTLVCQNIALLNPIARETSEIDSKGQITPAACFARASGNGYSLLVNFSVLRARASKNRYFEKFKINIFLLAVFKRNFPHESA